jgi:hypothetical protein
VNVSEELLPALSVQLPTSAVPVVSGPSYDSLALQAASPDVASLPTHSIDNAARYQPAALGGRFGVAAVVGATVS